MMLAGYHLITLTHRDALLEDISKSAIIADAPLSLKEQLFSLKAKMGWDELMYLSTCNRVMYFFYSPNTVTKNIAQELLETIRLDLSAAQVANIAGKMQVIHGAEAIQHVFEVASSIDSLVVGEREILRQMRQAYEQCAEWQLTSDNIRLAMRSTIETAKEIYTNTSIGEKSVSVVSLAFEAMMKQKIAKDARFLIVGAGQTNSLFSKFLLKKGFTNVAVFNRTIEKAHEIAKNFDGKCFLLSELEHYSEGFDVLVVCTASSDAIINADIYQKLLSGETNSKVVIDLSVPNNVAQQVVENFPIKYIDIESLRDTAQKNQQYRAQESEKGKYIIARRIEEYSQLWHERQVEISLQHIPAEIKAIKEKAVKEVFRKDFESLSPESQALMLQMLDYMEKKCVAIPMKTMKSIALKHGKTTNFTKNRDSKVKN
jgi:glutamyl-tRNA reductase